MTATIRERVAQVLYEEPCRDATSRTPWAELSASRRSPWLADADRVIPVVAAAAARVAAQKDPANPAGFLFRREQIANGIEGLLVGAPEEWECPIDEDGCVENCGSYGCGN